MARGNITRCSRRPPFGQRQRLHGDGGDIGFEGFTVTPSGKVDVSGGTGAASST
jgi:hypothetical protein